MKHLEGKQLVKIIRGDVDMHILFILIAVNLLWLTTNLGGSQTFIFNWIIAPAVMVIGTLTFVYSSVANYRTRIVLFEDSIHYLEGGNRSEIDIRDITLVLSGQVRDRFGVYRGRLIEVSNGEVLSIDGHVFSDAKWAEVAEHVKQRNYRVKIQLDWNE